ncbi:hypothetical protein J6590_020414 [Homalodisca vitripennis]|nr:hypothetical protein J6590_020414 [Homalodisca vitripennis]
MLILTLIDIDIKPTDKKEVLSNGSLYFPPFSQEEFSTDVHVNTYRCTATNSVGSIVSRDSKVRAGKWQVYLYILPIVAAQWLFNSELLDGRKSTMNTTPPIL